MTKTYSETHLAKAWEKYGGAYGKRLAKKALKVVKRSRGYTPLYVYRRLKDAEFYRLPDDVKVDVLQIAVRIAARGAWRGAFAKKRGGAKYVGWNEKTHEFPEERTTGKVHGAFTSAANTYLPVMDDRGAFYTATDGDGNRLIDDRGAVVLEDVLSAAGMLWCLVADGGDEELALADRDGEFLPFGRALVDGASRILKRRYRDERRRDTALFQTNDDGDDVLCIADVHVNGRIPSVEDVVVARISAEERIEELRRLGYAVGEAYKGRDVQAYRDITDELLKGEKSAASIARKLGIDERKAERVKARILDEWEYRMPR